MRLAYVARGVAMCERHRDVAGATATGDANARVWLCMLVCSQAWPYVLWVTLLLLQIVTSFWPDTSCFAERIKACFQHDIESEEACHASSLILFESESEAIESEEACHASSRFLK